MKEYNNNLKKIFDIISLNENYKIIGSSTKDLFFSDYDLNSILKFKNENKIFNEFKKVFEKAKKNENIWITDFKVGEDESGEPLRWSYNNIKKNDNRGYTFQEALKQKSTIKLDIVFYIDGKFVEITDNYYFDIDGYKTFEKLTPESRFEDLKNKFYEYVELGAYMKALKRLRSLSQNKKIIDELSHFFNSPIGLLYSLWSEISIIIQLLGLDKNINLDKIYNSLQRIKEHLSFFNIKNNIEKISKLKNKNSMIKHLIKQNEIINKYINKEVCSFIKKNKI
jgi:hypothetical protein